MSQAYEIVQSQTPTTSTLIEFLLDETGSMGHVRKATIDSFNEYVNSQRTQPGDCFLTLTKFDDRGIRTQYLDAAISTVQDLNEATYNPTGMTNLYDAIGTRIKALEARTSKDDGKAKLMVIMTDGQDNMSREYTPSMLTQLIKAKEAEGWTFVFLGANQDAWQVGQTFGMTKGNTMTYDTNNMHDTMTTLSAATSSYRSVRSKGIVGSTEASTDFFGNVK